MPNSIVTTTSFFAGIYWGAVGVATAYSISNYLILYPSLWYVYKNTPIKISDFFSLIIKAFIASLGMGVAGFTLQPFFTELSDFAFLIKSFLSCFIIYVFIWVVLPCGWKELRDYYSLGRLLFKKV